MSSERVFSLDQKTHELFALKGKEGGCYVPRKGNSNSVRVRRVMQIIRDFSNKTFDQLRILDMACGEGVFAIEAALRCAEVIALDARTEQINGGKNAAERLGLKNLCFEQTDIRNVNIASHGSADVVLFLGILYHLNQKDIFPILKNIYEMCNQFVLIDTHIALQGQMTVKYNGQSYNGKQTREHHDNDPEEVRRSRLLASLDNSLSFIFTKEALFRWLNDVGFTSVCECLVPLEPFKPKNRITILAAKGESVQISSYPWINDKSEYEIERLLADNISNTSWREYGGVTPWIKHLAKSIVNAALRAFDLEIRRI
jgi:SAM-dependent methyltransferase